MSNNNHVINITFVIVQALCWLLVFGTGTDMQLKKKKKKAEKKFREFLKALAVQQTNVTMLALPWYLHWNPEEAS